MYCAPHLKEVCAKYKCPSIMCAEASHMSHLHYIHTVNRLRVCSYVKTMNIYKKKLKGSHKRERVTCIASHSEEGRGGKQ